MKIALVHKKYTTHGGTERDMVELSNYLVKQGHEVHVFTGSWDQEVADERIKFHKAGSWGKHLGIDKYIFANNAYKEVQKYDFDIVQTFSRVGFGDVIRVGGGCHDIFVEKSLQSIENPLYEFKKKIEKSISLSDYFTRYYEAKDFKPENYKRIVAISNVVKQEIIEKYDVPSEDIVVNHIGVNIDKFKPENKKKYRKKIRKEHNLSEDDLVLLFLGSGFERKGLEYVLETMSKVKDVKLLVVGKGKINRYKRKAKKLGVLQRTIFVGASSEVEAYYAAGDIFVFPTIYEPFGKVITEAMASGLPVITTQVAGASEIITPHKEGYILETPDQISQLANYIEKLKDKDLRTEIAKAAREKTLNYTKDKDHQRILELYYEILNQK
ncbi:glycosyltransferase family 4 protein [Halanaerobaculum tunisiense]